MSMFVRNEADRSPFVIFEVEAALARNPPRERRTAVPPLLTSRTWQFRLLLRHFLCTQHSLIRLYRGLSGNLDGTFGFRSLLAAQRVSFRVELTRNLDWRRCIQIMANARDENLGPLFAASYAFMFITSRHNKDCWTAKKYVSEPLSIRDCPLPWRTVVALVLEAGINVYKQEILDVSFVSLWDLLRPDLHHRHLVTCSF